MKKLVIISLALLLSAGTFAQTSGVGIGVKLGSTVDFTAKFWTGEKTAFTAAAGLSYWYDFDFHVNADYLIHNWSIDIAQDQLKVFFGPGVEVGFYSTTRYYYANDNYIRFTIRAPGGVGYYFHGFPLEAFAELAPGVDVFGPWGFNFRWNSYVGARWYF